MAVGIGLALFATICFACGNVIEKRAVDRLPQFSMGNLHGVVKALASSPWWVAGAIISVVGLGVQILAYSHIAISIVQSVGVAGVVLLVALARVSLHERLRHMEIGGLGVAVVSYPGVRRCRGGRCQSDRRGRGCMLVGRSPGHPGHAEAA